MNHNTIKKLQKVNGFYEMQQMINNGMAWKMEGSVGRQAMYLLEVGACMLPKKTHRDFYGNMIPSRDDLKAGTKGTYKNTVSFYQNENFFITDPLINL
jgi:hypothetical protein